MHDITFADLKLLMNPRMIKTTKAGKIEKVREKKKTQVVSRKVFQVIKLFYYLSQ